MPDEPILRPYAASLKLKARAPLPVAAWEQAASKFFNALVAGCREKGAVVIGHIKGFLDLGPSGYLYLSTVGTSTGTSSRGTGTGTAITGSLDLNVLVYGLDPGEISALVADTAPTLGRALQADWTIHTASGCHSHHNDDRGHARHNHHSHYNRPGTSCGSRSGLDK